MVSELTQLKQWRVFRGKALLLASGLWRLPFVVFHNVRRYGQKWALSLGAKMASWDGFWLIHTLSIAGLVGRLNVVVEIGSSL